MKQITHKLLDWFQKNKRKLPWRETDDPYAIWVSEVMLQQTQVNTVIPYYLRFMTSFPDVNKLANARQDNVLKSWEGLGYYARAVNLHRASHIVVEKFNGQVPSDPALFRQLPGVGDYINAAVQSIAFGEKLAVVDGNVRRVLSRLYEMTEMVNQTKYAKVFASKADDLLSHDKPGDFNQAVMELGALICKPRQPLCDQCPVSAHCQAFKNDSVLVFPKRHIPPKIPTENWVAAIIKKDNKVLLTQRKTDGFLGGLWEFPGGKVHKNETSQDACLRYIQEQLKLEVRIISQAEQVKHAYTHFKQKMHPFICQYEAGDIILNGPVDYQWIFWSDIHQFALPKSNLKFLKKFDELI